MSGYKGIHRRLKKPLLASEVQGQALAGFMIPRLGFCTQEDFPACGASANFCWIQGCSGVVPAL